MLSKSSYPVVVSFLDRNYRYKSVGTQIPHDPLMEPFSYTEKKIGPTRDRISSACPSTSSILITIVPGLYILNYHNSENGSSHKSKKERG
jgi:hypothetical protein